MYILSTKTIFFKSDTLYILIVPFERATKAKLFAVTKSTIL